MRDLSETKNEPKITDAYISVDVQDDALARLCQSLKDVLNSSGIECEAASACPHVSIAYGEGDCSMHELVEAVREISLHSFKVRALDFELFEGLRTQFDYLVLKVDSKGDIEETVEIAREHMPCRGFKDGLRSHISLVRFPKGALNQEVARNLIREMNASQAAAFVLGKNPIFTGARVNVYDPNRQCRLTAAFEAALGMASA